MNNKSIYASIARSLWINSAVISKHLDNSLGAIHGIGLTEYMVLFNLIEAPNNILRRIDIADALGRTASGITRMLIPMEKIGLIKKETNKRDARVSLVKITPIGKETFTNASVTLDKKASSLLKNLNSKKAETLLKFLNTI